MKGYINKKIVAGFIIVVATILTGSGLCTAERITDSSKIPYWEYTYFQSMVTQVSPEMDYIVTSKRKVYLVEADYKAKSLCTSIRDEKGEEIDLSRIKPGKWVFVWGAILGNHSIGAKDITLLPHKLTNRELDNLRTIKNRKKFVYHTN